VSRERILAGDRSYPLAEAEARVELLHAGFLPDYFSVRCARTLEPAAAEQDLVILAAAWLGRTRLIDNITLTLPAS
jgi:pantoate--beta-alanine ligase